MPELSPPAREVLAAYRADWKDEHLKQDVKCLAAALRAVADQVVPDQGAWIRECRGDAWTRWKEHKLIRREILAIANKLEAQ